ncbi:MAG: DUF5666 domain-containing protein [Anaerolineae bacterium]
MRRDVASILDECLSRLSRGESLESCLARYPQEAAEVAPLLHTALAVRILKETAPPSAVALAAGRRRFLEEAARRRQAQVPSWPERLRALGEQIGDLLQRGIRGQPALGRLATAVLTALLLFALLGGGTVAVSAHSLPGDPLYPIKRATEQVQLLLTFDPLARTDLQSQFQERRRAEVQAVVAQGRQVMVELPGPIQSLSETIWWVGGYRVILQADTVVEGEPAVGLRADVEAVTQADGSLLARRITVEGRAPRVPPQPTATPELRPKPTATPTATATDTPTKEPTLTLMPSPSPTPSPTPTATPSPSSTPTPTATSTPTAVPQPPRAIKVKFEGLIEAMDEDGWTIAGQKVLINDETIIEHGELAEVGAWAVVQAVRQPDGSLLALRITITRAAEKPPQPIEFTGTIDSFSDKVWIVGGVTILINEDTVIEGTPQVGAVAHVRAVRQPDGSLLALRIVVEPLEEQVVEFEGPIQSIGPDSWVVAGRTVLVDANTVIVGTPRVGAMAEVRAIARADGTLLATRIEVQEPTETPQPTATATLTPAPTETPTQTTEPTQVGPTETPQPTATATLTPAPTETPMETGEPASAEPTATAEGTGTPTPLKREEG